MSAPARLSIIREPTEADFRRFNERDRNERDQYFERVSLAMRSAVEVALVDDGLTIAEARVLLAGGMWELASYSRLALGLYRDRLLDRARVGKRQGQRALGALHEKGAQLWYPGRGRGRQGFIALPAWHDPRAPLLFPISGEKVSARDTFSTRKGVTRRREKVSSGDTPSRSSREKQIHLFNPDERDLRCFVCGEPAVDAYAGQWWCARHLEEQVG